MPNVDRRTIGQITFSNYGRLSSDQAPILAFLQLRVASEAYVVWQCGWAVQHALKTLEMGQWTVYFEKWLSFGRADLVLMPEGKNEDEAFVFEFKIAWPGSIGAAGICSDLKRLKKHERGFCVVFLFAFTESEEWAPYGVKKGGLEELERTLSDALRSEPFWRGTPFPLVTEGARGAGQLIVWRPQTNDF